MLPSPDTAYHEAGHVVAMLSLGVPFRYATVRPKGPAKGKVVLDRRLRPVSPHRSAVILLAGPAAEAQYAKAQGRTHRFNATSTDYGRAMMAAYKAKKSTNSLWFEAARLVAARWSEVELVASALLASPRALTSNQIKSLLSERSFDEAAS